VGCGDTNPQELKRQLIQKEHFFETVASEIGIYDYQNGKNALNCQAVNRPGIIVSNVITVIQLTVTP
jgi:hypothetical protein